MIIKKGLKKWILILLLSFFQVAIAGVPSKNKDKPLSLEKPIPDYLKIIPNNVVELNDLHYFVSKPQEFNAKEAKKYTLQNVISMALRTSPDVIARLRSFLAAKQSVQTSIGGFLPNVNLVGRVGTDNVSSRDGNGEFPYRHYRPSGAEISFSQMLFDGFATYNEVARNKHRSLAEKFRLQNAADEVALLVTKAYIDVLRTKQILVAANDNYQAHLKTYNMIKDRAASGLDRAADSTQARSRLAVSKINLMAFKNNHESALEVFERVTGLPAKQMQLVVPTAPLEPYLSLTQKAAEQKALVQHPSLRAAEADIQEARAGYKTHKASLYPHLNLVASAEHGSELYRNQGRYTQNKVGLEMRYNLFNGGSDMSRKNEAAEIVARTQALRDKTYRQVVEDVRLSWNLYLTSKQQLPLYKECEQASYLVVQAYHEQFKLGRRTLLDLLNSENELFNARISNINSEFNYLLNLYQVLKAEGGLLTYLKVASAVAV